MPFEPGMHRFEEYPERLKIEADVCIIGAGAGGCATAAALAERGKTVAVLEEGRNWRPSDFKPRASWAFEHLYAGRGMRNAKGNTVIPLPGGRGVGGSTLINSAISLRTPAPVLARWRDAFGCTLFTDDWMDACFERIYRTISVSVSPPEVMGENNRVFKEGSDKLGLKGAWMPRSAPGCTGCALCQQGCPSGGKFSVDRTFLAEALATGRVAVYPDCRIDDVRRRGDRVQSVSGRTLHPDGYRPAGEVEVTAKVFVFSAGAIATPRLLLQNGLSDGPVGKQLFVHPTCGAAARFPRPIAPWRGATQGFYVDCWDEGYLLQTFTFPPDQLYLMLPLGPEASLEEVRQFGTMGLAGTVVHDEDSAGSVTASGIHYSVGDGDRRRLLAGLRRVAEVFFAAGAEAVIPGVQTGKLRTMAEVNAALHDDIPAYDIAIYASHPMTTCRMGKDPAHSVADPTGRVWEWENLYLADASVFPTSLGVNPQVTVMAVGLTIGREIAGQIG